MAIAQMITLESGVVAGYHEVAIVTVNLKTNLAAVTIDSYVNQAVAAANGKSVARTVYSIPAPTIDVAGIEASVLSLYQTMFNPALPPGTEGDVP